MLANMVLSDERVYTSQNLYEESSPVPTDRSFNMTRVVSAIFDELLERPALHEDIEKLEVRATISSREQMPCLWAINGN